MAYNSKYTSGPEGFNLETTGGDQELEDFIKGMRPVQGAPPMMRPREPRPQLGSRGGPDPVRRTMGGGMKFSPGSLYAAALRPRHAFGSGAQHYEIDERFAGDPALRAMQPQNAQMTDSGSSEGPQDSWLRYLAETRGRGMGTSGNF